MGRGRSLLKTCFFCGRQCPVDKMSRTTKYSFSYFDERAGLQHRGIPQTVLVCPSCARRRSIDDQRPRHGRPK